MAVSLLRLAALTSLSISFFSAAQNALPSLSEPAISPNGQEIAFVSGGDIWTVPAAGGEAHLLVSDPATESRPLYSPDGTRLAFISTRTGAGDIYVLTFATGDLTRITYSDAPDQLDNWSPDSRWLYFTSAIDDVAGQGDIFRVASTGGTPLEVSHERYLNEFEAAPSPDGQSIALVARGISNRQWWRNGHAHIDETELWLKPVAESATYTRILPGDAKHGWPMWSADGKTLFYMSDGSGAENLWSLPLAGPSSAKQVTTFKSGRVLWPSIGDGGRTIVFERTSAIWKLDTASGKSERVPITLRGVAPSPGVTHMQLAKFQHLALSPDGKKVAVIGHGEIFAASAKDGGDAQRITHSATAESDAAWSPDSTKLLYISETLDGHHQLFFYDFATSKAQAITAPLEIVAAPMWSPDGKQIAFVRDTHELHVLMLPEKPSDQMPYKLPEDRKVAIGGLGGGWDDAALAWSPDSQWIAFGNTDSKSFRNVWVVKAAGGEAQPVSFLANGETASSIAWSADGKYILFDTAQRSEDAQIARIDLLPHVPKYREDEFQELFKPSKVPGTPSTPAKPSDPSTKPAPDKPAEPAAEARSDKSDKPDKEKPDAPEKKKIEPVKIVFEGIRSRLSLLPLGIGAQNPIISPDGKTLLFAARSTGQQNLYTYSLDELAKEPAVARQLTSTPGRKQNFFFTADSKDVFFLEAGTVKSISLEARTPKPVAISASLDVDFDMEKKVVFEEMWETLNQEFYDKTFGGRDWTALRAEWAPYIAGTRNGDELRRDLNLLIGELNASHSGINRADAPGIEPVPVGNLGLRFDREAYEAGKGLIVREVIALGPAATSESIKPGDRLVSVDGEAVAARNLDSMLSDTVGRKVTLGIETAGKLKDVAVRPVTTPVAVGLLYRQWVEERRAYVDRISGGKIGYVHMADMGEGSLHQLYIDLDAQNESKQGVVVDVRNNNGGYVNGYALDVFTRRNYLIMTPRWLGPVPSRQALGQRALGLPTVLVTNESSLSDAEDFTEGYRSLQLGKVVGQPTAGWIIFTGSQPLIDGSSVRVPGARIQDLRGQTMEMNPRPVDIEVERPLGETQAGKDAQLERAVKELLNR